jgi:superfamily II DNA helicase RecQ
MKYRIFTIPIHAGEAATGELNRFLSTHQIISVEHQFAQNGANSAWSICVSYVAKDGRPSSLAKKAKIDYREVLKKPDFQVYAKLRALRKTLAEREGVPAYALFTNQQLAHMVQQRVTSAAGMREIAGIGESKVTKYGDAFLEILQQEIPALIDSRLGNNKDET